MPRQDHSQFKFVQCGQCGTSVKIPYDVALRLYQTMGVECGACGAIAGSSNGKTGEIYSWMSPAQVAEANAEYQAQMFSADMNEFYGRGNHPF